jgi:LacI family transcriptional regulator
MATRRNKNGNILEIARLANVSTASVSRVLNNKPGVSENVRSEVMKVVRKFNYSPKQTTIRTNVIGVSLEWANTFDSFYVTSLMNTIENLAFEAGFDILLLRNERLRSERNYLDLYLHGKMLAGLIVMALGNEDVFTTRMARDNFPHMVIGTQDSPNYNSVGCDTYQGAYQATEYLISIGHARIGLIHHGLNLNFEHRQRLQGYIDALNDNGIGYDPNLVLEMLSGYWASSGYEDTNTLLGRFPDTTALLAPSHAAISIMRSLKEHNLAVPEKFSLVGFDDLPSYLIEMLPLTVVAQDIEEIGTIAIRDLIRQIEQSGSQPMAFKQIKRPSRLIIRKTAGRIPPRK